MFIISLKLIASYFDYISIVNSKVNNYNLCNLRDEFEVEKDIKVNYMYKYIYIICFS